MRVLVTGDRHSGHNTGLTPPAWQYNAPHKSTTKRKKWGKIQRDLWNEYKRMLKKFAPYDMGIDLADMIDGTGHRSGGTELITPDREEQCDIAVAGLDEVRLHANKGFEWHGVYGTGYHTGDSEDWENIVANRAGFASIGSHQWLDINGCVIDIKHHVGSSGIPHGRFTAIAKEKLWNTLWAEHEGQPKSNIILRGHTHYHAFCGQPGWMAMTNPALQGAGTKYGGRRCSGVVHFGLTVIDIDKDGSFDWHTEVATVESQKAEAIKIGG